MIKNCFCILVKNPEIVKSPYATNKLFKVLVLCPLPLISIIMSEPPLSYFVFELQTSNLLYLYRIIKA